MGDTGILTGITLDNFCSTELPSKLSQRITQHTVAELMPLDIVEAEEKIQEFRQGLKAYFRTCDTIEKSDEKRFRNIAIEYIIAGLMKKLTREGHITSATRITYLFRTLERGTYSAETADRGHTLIVEKDKRTYTRIPQAYRIIRQEQQAIVVTDIRTAGRTSYKKREERKKESIREILGEEPTILAVYTAENYRKARKDITRFLTKPEHHTLIIRYDPRIFDRIVYNTSQQAIYGQTDKISPQQDQQHGRRQQTTPPRPNPRREPQEK